MTVIAVFNQKGGVGKTTTSLNLLAGIAQRKQRPLGIDLDPQAHLSGIFGIRPRLADESVYSFFMRQRPLGEVSQITDSGVILCPGHLELTKLDTLLGKGVNVVTRLRTALKTADVAPGSVVIDCCPLLGILSLNAIFACDLIVIPVSADYLALQGAQQVERSLNALEPVFKRRLPRRNLRDTNRRECEPGGESRAPARCVSTCAAEPRRTRLPSAGRRASGCRICCVTSTARPHSRWQDR